MEVIWNAFQIVAFMLNREAERRDRLRVGGKGTGIEWKGI